MRAYFLAIIFSCFVVVRTAQGGIIYEDHFLTGSPPANGEYAAFPTASASAAQLPGQNPTLTNAASAWTNLSTGGGVASSVNHFARETGLTFGSAPVSGGAVESSRNSGNATGTIITSGRPAVDNAATTMSLGEEFYFSGLVQSVSASYQVGVGIQFLNRSNFGIGINGAGAAGFFVNNAFNAGTVNLTTDAAGDNIVLNQTYFIVGKVTPTAGTISDPELISLLLVATDPSQIPVSAPAAVNTLSADVWGDSLTTDTLQHFVLYGRKSPSGLRTLMDELRVGDTYASVLPITVPEPSTIVLSSIGFVLILGAARRAAARRL